MTSDPPGARRPRPELLVGAVAVLLVLGGGLVVLEDWSGRGRGPAREVASTGPEGFAAYAQLLDEQGHSVQRGDLSHAVQAARGTDPSQVTAIVTTGDLDDDEVGQARALLARGGTVVALGPSPASALVDGLGLRVGYTPTAGSERRVLAPVPEVAGVERVDSPGRGALRPTGPFLPAIGSESGALLAVGELGGGRLVLLAEAGMLQNDYLARADNAALGVGLAGEASRAVVFVEGGPAAAGLGALPADWRLTGMGVAAAALIGLWAGGKRLGPPSPADGRFSPPRVEAVHALAASLGRTGDSAAAGARLKAVALERLTARGALEPGAAPAEVRAAGLAAGLGADEAEALVQDVPDVLAAGRALAALEGGTR